MTTIDRRLRTLETVWRQSQATDPRSERLRELEASAAMPAEASALRWAAGRKARRRYLAEVDWPFAPSAWPDPRWFFHPGRPVWELAIGSTDSPAFRERVARELADLHRMRAALGADAALDTWLAETEAWPLLSWQRRPLRDEYARELAIHRAGLERLRASPELAGWRARSGWHPEGIG